MAARSAGGAVLTGTLEMWHAAALLVIHGSPAYSGTLAAVLIHDIVEGESPERGALSPRRATSGAFRPAVASFPARFGPAYGLLLNALIYLRSWWLCKHPTAGFRKGTGPVAR